MTTLQTSLPQATPAIRRLETLMKLTLAGILLPPVLGLLPVSQPAALNSVLFASLAILGLATLAWTSLMLRGTLRRGL